MCIKSSCLQILFTFVITLFVLYATGQHADINLLKKINPQQPTSGFWNTTSKSYIVVSGATSVGSLAYAFIKNNKELQHRSVETFFAIGLNVAATGALKSIFRRERPYERYPDDVFPATFSNGHSLPSGHTSLAFATATSVSLAYKKWYVTLPAYLWAGLVGYSRLYLGRHYPTDVLAGAIVGAGSSYISHWLGSKIYRHTIKTTSQSQ